MEKAGGQRLQQRYGIIKVKHMKDMNKVMKEVELQDFLRSMMN